MQPISLYWFAAQQQTSTLRGQKCDLFYVKFSAKFNELSLFFKKQQEVAEKWLKLNYSGKTPIGVIRTLRVNELSNEEIKRLIETAQDFFHRKLWKI